MWWTYAAQLTPGRKEFESEKEFALLCHVPKRLTICNLCNRFRMKYLHARCFEKCFLFPFYIRSEDTIKNYIMWRVVDKYVMSMPFKFVQAKREFQEAIIGVQEYKRWSYC